MALTRRASLGSNPRTPPQPQDPQRDPNVFPRVFPWCWEEIENSDPFGLGGEAAIRAAIYFGRERTNGNTPRLRHFGVEYRRWRGGRRGDATTQNYRTFVEAPPTDRSANAGEVQVVVAFA